MCNTAGSLLNLSHSYGNPLPTVCECVSVYMCANVCVLSRVSKGGVGCVSWGIKLT